MVFKQPPSLPVVHKLRGCTDAEFLEDAEHVIGHQLSIWADMLEEVKQRHDKYDWAMVEAYLSRKGSGVYDMRFIFPTGDKVLLQ